MNSIPCDHWIFRKSICWLLFYTILSCANRDKTTNACWDVRKNETRHQRWLYGKRRSVNNKKEELNFIIFQAITFRLNNIINHIAMQNVYQNDEKEDDLYDWRRSGPRLKEVFRDPNRTLEKSHKLWLCWKVNWWLNLDQKCFEFIVMQSNKESCVTFEATLCVSLCCKKDCGLTTRKIIRFWFVSEKQNSFLGCRNIHNFKLWTWTSLPRIQWQLLQLTLNKKHKTVSVNSS